MQSETFSVAFNISEILAYIYSNNTLSEAYRDRGSKSSVMLMIHHSRNWFKIIAGHRLCLYNLC